jgi:hypothetical protein
MCVAPAGKIQSGLDRFSARIVCCEASTREEKAKVRSPALLEYCFFRIATGMAQSPQAQESGIAACGGHRDGRAARMRRLEVTRGAGEPRLFAQVKIQHHHTDGPPKRTPFGQRHLLMYDFLLRPRAISQLVRSHQPRCAKLISLCNQRRTFGVRVLLVKAPCLCAANPANGDTRCRPPQA